jgi:hypothetical protein
MIAARLLQRIETNWEAIAQAVIASRNQDPNLTSYRALSDQEIRDRVRDLTTNLGRWLYTKDDASIAYHYEQLGSTRHAQGVPLHEVIQKLISIKRAIRTYASEQNYNLSPVDIYDELELLRAMAGYFDFVIFRVAKGYEGAMRASTDSGSSRPPAFESAKAQSA